jgi:hypothetical protein
MKYKYDGDVIRSLDGRIERWVWVAGKKNAYICDTHDEFAHFVARACAMGLKPRFESFLKGE